MRFKETVKKYRLASALFAFSLFLTIYASIWAYVVLGSSSQPLILHFSEFAGITKTGSGIDLVLLGVFGCLLVLANYILSVLLESRERFLARLLAGGTLLLSVLIFISVSAIISVN